MNVFQKKEPPPTNCTGNSSSSIATSKLSCRFGGSIVCFPPPPPPYPHTVHDLLWYESIEETSDAITRVFGRLPRGRPGGFSRVEFVPIAYRCTRIYGLLLWWWWWIPSMMVMASCYDGDDGSVSLMVVCSVSVVSTTRNDGSVGSSAVRDDTDPHTPQPWVCVRTRILILVPDVASWMAGTSSLSGSSKCIGRLPRGRPGGFSRLEFVPIPYRCPRIY